MKPVGKYNQWHDFPVTDTVQKWVSGHRHELRVRAEGHGRVGHATPTGGPRYEAGDGDTYGGETSTIPRLTVTYGKVGTALNSPTVVHGTGPELSWPAYVNTRRRGERRIVEYQLHRSTQQVFTPSAATLVAPIAVDDDRVHGHHRGADPGLQLQRDREVVLLPARGEDQGRRAARVADPGGGHPEGRPDDEDHPGRSDGHDAVLAAADHQPGRDPVLRRGPDLAERRQQLHHVRQDARRAEVPHQLGIPTTATVLENKLYMWGAETTSTTNGAIYELHALTRDFTETTATWNNATSTTAWTTPGGDMSATVSDTVPQITDEVGRHWWDATGLMQSWVKTPAEQQGRRGQAEGRDHHRPAGAHPVPVVGGLRPAAAARTCRSSTWTRRPRTRTTRRPRRRG